VVWEKPEVLAEHFFSLYLTYWICLTLLSCFSFAGSLNTDGEGNEKLFSILYVLLVGLKIKFTKRLTGEEKSFITCAERSNNEIENEKNDQGRQFLYFLDKETINL